MPGEVSEESDILDFTMALDAMGLAGWLLAHGCSLVYGWAVYCVLGDIDFIFQRLQYLDGLLLT